MERIELDGLDKLAAKTFEGYVVRKNLVRELKGQYPVPTYVVEFLLGRYCASVDPDEIEEGKKIVQRQLADKAIRTGEEELFKSRAREKGSIRIIDLITARLESDSYFVTLPSLQLRNVGISPELVLTHEWMLTGGFYADIELEYDTAFMDRLHAYIPGWDIPKLHPDKHFTDHFGLVSDFLSECWSHLRTRSRVTTLSGRVFFGGALSGRDTTAVQKTVSGLHKLLHPDPEAPIPDESLEWAVRIVLEVRRRVKGQQKRTPSGPSSGTLISATRWARMVLSSL